LTARFAVFLAVFALVFFRARRFDPARVFGLIRVVALRLTLAFFPDLVLELLLDFAMMPPLGSIL
jgi:hypothetical protein